MANLMVKSDELPKHSFVDTFNKDESLIDDILSESFNHSIQSAAGNDILPENSQ